MDYSKYIFPIDSTTDGSGVLVGNLFITAGHVVEMSIKPTVVINGRSYLLKNAQFIETNAEKRSDGYDVAIFHLEDINSPLKLANELPFMDEELLSCSIRHIIKGDALAASTNIFSSLVKEEWAFEERIGKVIHFYDNYFECMFDDPLSRGSSGSPIIKDDKVFGILYGDKEGKSSSNTVLYLSSKAIVERINKK